MLLSLLPSLLALTLLSSPAPPTAGDGLDVASKRILSQAKKDIVSDDAELRDSALGKLAALKEPDPEEPSAAIAQAIAKGLLKSKEPKDVLFRMRALLALSMGRHQGTATEAYVDSLGVLKDELDMLDSYYPSINRDRMPTRRGWDLLLYSFAGTQMNYVVAFDDERCEKAVIKWVNVDPTKQTRTLFEMEAHALTQMGTQSSIAAVIDAWQGLEKKLRKGPIKGLAGTSSTPLVPLESTVGTRAIISHIQPANENSLRLIHDELLAKITQEGLPADPSWSADTAATAKLWKAWLKAHKKGFKKKLGKLQDDVPVTPTRPIQRPWEDDEEKAGT